MIEKGDSIAVTQFEEFNKTFMPDYSLSEKEVDAGLSY